MAKAKPKPITAEKPAASALAYDAVPYHSLSFPQTNPLLLQGIAKLFRLSTPKPDTARILEIGCASGGNILSIACSYPNSKCVGIDYSQKQVEAGQQDVKALGITNLELKHMSVMDVTKSFGTFDYIICHGVLSWVPADAQEKIFKVCKANLAPDGIAYISYNTLPGWNGVRSIRDMMIYHTAHTSDPVAKVQQARWLLKFMNDSTKDSKSTMASAVAREIEILAGQPDHYLLHEHLEEHNTAFYFHEIMARVQANGLNYVGDTSIETMYSGNLPESVAKELAAITDIVRAEQYMDFLRDRRFRQTLLCHNDRIPNRNLNHDNLREGWVVSRFGYPEGFAQHNILSDQKLDFQVKGNMKLTTSDPATLAALQVLMEHKSEPVSIKRLAELVREKLRKINFKRKEEASNPLELQVSYLLMRGLFLGGVQFYMDALPYATRVSKKPVASKLARYQVQKKELISNQCQECKYLLPFDRVLLGYLDGTHDVAALVECMLPHFAAKTLAMNKDNVPVEDMAVIKSTLPSAIAERLGSLCESALLVG